MWRDPQRRAAYRSEAVHLGHCGGRVRERFFWQAYAEHVGAALVVWDGVQSESAGFTRDRRRSLGEGRGHPRYLPIDDLFQRRDRHRQQLEFCALTDVEASCAWLILVAIVNQPRKVLGSRAQNPVLLERLAFTVLLGHVEVADAEGPQQPFVTHRD